MKKHISLIIVLTIFTASMICSTYAEADSVPYIDASSWAVPELERASEYGFITDKMGDKMNVSITREELAELAVLLYEKYTGAKAIPAEINTFADTVNPEVLKAYDLDIVEGTDSFWKLFSPEDTATREQVAVMLYRTIKAMDTGADMEVPAAGTFSDEGDISRWALEAVSFMNRNEFIKGGDGRIDPQGTCTREMAVLVTARIYEKYFSENNEGINEGTADNGEINNESSNGAYFLKQIVVNDVEIYEDDYQIKKQAGNEYIFLTADKFKYAFKQPNAGYYTYPEVNIFGSSISINWSSEAGTVMHADMQEGSNEALINGKKVDIGIAPYSQNEKMFIPVNLFIEARAMNIEAGSNGDVLYIQYKEDFLKDTLVGTWSDTDLDLFKNRREITTGAMTVSSFATAYRFSADGTYGLCMVSTGSNNDIYIMQEGKYRIMGSTILCYDIAETVYKGNPFELQYSDKVLETPQYLFIYNYEPKTEKIEIGGFWLDKL